MVWFAWGLKCFEVEWIVFTFVFMRAVFYWAYSIVVRASAINTQLLAVLPTLLEQHEAGVSVIQTIIGEQRSI